MAEAHLQHRRLQMAKRSISLIELKSVREKIAITLVAIVFFGCTDSPESKHMSKASAALQASDFEGALDSYEKVIKGYPKSKTALEAARKAVKVATANSKNYVRLADFLRSLILLSKDSEELLVAQRQLAEVYFEKLFDYERAIVEFNRLLEFPHSSKEAFNYRFTLSKAFFFLGKFDQAVVEIDEAIGKAQEKEDRFQGELMKANIYTAQKKIDRAIPILTKILDDYPEYSERDNVGITLSIAQEEKGDFEKAISTLEHLKEKASHPEFLQLRIDRLKERQAQMPGASGLRK